MSKDFLRDYQKDAVDKMRNGCILNGGVGSGKSRTGLYYYFKENGGSFIDQEYVPMKNPQLKVGHWMTSCKRTSISSKPDIRKVLKQTRVCIEQKGIFEMIKIIKPGYLKEAQCLKCGAVLSYDENEDVETRYERGIASTMETYRKPVKYLTCPQCKNEIVLKAVR